MLFLSRGQARAFTPHHRCTGQAPPFGGLCRLQLRYRTGGHDVVPGNALGGALVVVVEEVGGPPAYRGEPGRTIACFGLEG